MNDVPEPRAIIPGESLDGYTAYRSEKLGLSSIKEVAELLEIEVPGRVRISRSGVDCAPLAEFFDVPEAEISTRVQPLESSARRAFLGTTVDRLHLVRLQRLFAPAALVKSPHHRAIWDLRPFPFSDETGEHLQCRCPDPLCQRVQSWYQTFGIANCDMCGEPLTAASSTFVADTDREALETAVGLFHHDPIRRAESTAALPAWLGGVPVGDVLDLLVALAGVIDPTIRTPSCRRTLRAGAAAEAVCTAMAAAWRMIFDWPGSFSGLAADRCGRRGGRFGDGNSGATMDFLALADLPGTPAFLKSVATTGITRMRGQAHEEGIETAEAGRMRGLKPTDLARARRDGTIPTVFAVTGDRAVPLLHRASVEDLSRRFVESTPIDVVAANFGCTVHGVEQACVMELLGPEADLHLPLTGGIARVPVSGIDAFLTRLSTRSHACERNATPLERALCALGGVRKPYGPLLHALSSGRIPFHLADGDGTLLSRIAVPPEAAAPLAMLAFDATMLPFDRRSPLVTKGDAIAELNLHHRNAAAILSCWPINKGAPTVPVAWLEDMCRRYVTVLEIAARMGVHGQSAHHVLRLAGLEPAQPHLYDRAEVQELIIGRSGRGTVSS